MFNLNRTYLKLKNFNSSKSLIFKEFPNAVNTRNLFNLFLRYIWHDANYFEKVIITVIESGD